MPAPTPRGSKRREASVDTVAYAAPKAKAKARARSVSIGSVATTRFYPEEETPIQPPPKARGRPRKTNVVLPTMEDAQEHADAEVAEVRRRGKEQQLQTRVLANAAKFTRQPKGKAKVAARKAAPLPPIPEAAVPSKKPRVRKVALAASSSPVIKDDLVVKRGRGRPKGSLGQKKREQAAWLEAESRKIDAVRL